MDRVAISSKVPLGEDSEDVAEVMTMLLRSQGYTVETACDGLAAVELAAWFQPDIALLDIGMPRLDGYETARLIRRQLGPTVALVALTAFVNYSIELACG